MYITLFGTCESYDDSSYPRQVEQEDGSTKTEMVPQFTLSLAIPGMRDLVRVSFGEDTAPKRDQAAKWEEQGTTMLKVSADKMNLASGIRGKKSWAVVSFHGMSAVEASSDEVSRLTVERKAAKAASKQRRDAARAAKLAKIA